ncbi:MAG: hypothetical protein PVI58_10600, partial [Desulfobacterales bacterium]
DPMSLRQRFIDATQKAFSFLTETYGFTLSLPETDSSLESLRYENLPLYVEISWYKGELDVIVGYAGETPILRPYKSRIFLLSEIALHLDSRSLESAPRFPDYITGENDVRTALAYWSQIMKTSCPEILSGNINTLEQIALKRQH